MKQAVEEYISKIEKQYVDYDYNLLNQTGYKKEVGDEITIGWNYVKWYEGDYEDVNAIMYSLGKLSEADLPYHYIRIGEEYDDIDERYVQTEDGYGVEYMGIIREFDDNM